MRMRQGIPNAVVASPSRSGPRPRQCLLLGLLALMMTLAFGRDRISSFLSPVTTRLRGGSTVAQRVARHGPAVRERLEPHFAAAGVAYPPQRVVLLALKKERRLELYAEMAGRGPIFVRSYPIVAAGGELGPKLRFGDGQVPRAATRSPRSTPTAGTTCR